MAAWVVRGRVSSFPLCNTSTPSFQIVMPRQPHTTALEIKYNTSGGSSWTILIQTHPRGRWEMPVCMWLRMPPSFPLGVACHPCMAVPLHFPRRVVSMHLLTQASGVCLHPLMERCDIEYQWQGTGFCTVLNHLRFTEQSSPKEKYIFTNNYLFCYVQSTLHIPVTGDIV